MYNWIIIIKGLSGSGVGYQIPVIRLYIGGTGTVTVTITVKIYLTGSRSIAVTVKIT
jgi:hypothetical protein